VGQLAREELEEAVQLGCVPPERRRQVGGVGVLHGFDRTDLELEPVAEAVDAAEHAHGVALGEALLQELDVVPDPSLDPPAGIDELEREVGTSRAGAESLLPRHRVDALDDPVVLELRDRAHCGESRGERGRS
jgi:hypothetical protein